jgi:hypothetical protein
MYGYRNYKRSPLKKRGKNMSQENPNDAFANQDILHLLTVNELRELSNLKELMRSVRAVLNYFQERESEVFKTARTRINASSA